MMIKRQYFKFFYVFSVVVLLFPSRGATEQDSMVSFTTQDGIKIMADYRIPATTTNGSTKHPAVIFIHQGGSSKEEWTSRQLYNQVVAHKMAALAYDVRGHGESGGKADFSTLFNDPAQAPLDLKAAIGFLIDTGLVDQDRIAIVGASIGSNLASMAIGSDAFNIKTAVAISGKTSATYNLAGLSPNEMSFKSIYHIASENEQGGQRAIWANELFSITNAPRLLEIIEGSSRHGVAIFADDPSLETRILKWLLETL